ncbi:MAG: ribonuclease III [Deltaproteobacteria bacterium]|nr:ribonuclease III [Deltaproteobacteria bacterium]
MDKERIGLLGTLETIIRHHFKDLGVLEEALTHRSYVNECPGTDKTDNERLEFLGDAVIQLCVSELLMEELPDSSEGDLTKLRAALVNERRLADVAQVFGLGDYLHLGKGEETSGGRCKNSILANTFEAVAGAVFLDGGYDGALSFIKVALTDIIRELIQEPSHQNFKSLLQELSQREYRTSPCYELLSETGPDHEKNFEVRVSVGEHLTAAGSGKSKKSAEQNAARKAYLALVEKE